MRSSPCDYFCKILIIGDSSVGKTSILHKFSYNSFNEQLTTLQISYQLRSLELKNKIMK